MRPRRDAVIPTMALKFVGRFYDLFYAHFPPSHDRALRGESLSSSELGFQTPLQYTLRPTKCAVVTDDGNCPAVAALPNAICRVRYYLSFYHG